MVEQQGKLAKLLRRAKDVDAPNGALRPPSECRPMNATTLPTMVPVKSSTVEKVGYDGESGKVTVAFRAAGIRELCRRAESEN